MLHSISLENHKVRHKLPNFSYRPVLLNFFFCISLILQAVPCAGRWRLATFSRTSRRAVRVAADGAHTAPRFDGRCAASERQECAMKTERTTFERRSARREVDSEFSDGTERVESEREEGPQCLQSPPAVSPSCQHEAPR